MILKLNNLKKKRICVVGLGYVGLPLAFEFSRYFKVLGVDNDKSKIENFKKTYTKNINFQLKTKIEKKFNADVYIVTVPTPLNNQKKPDLSFLINSTNSICKNLKLGDLIIYESTVYPGTTEEVLIPLIKKKTKLIYNKDFFVGYSPERINPGDKKNKLSNIKKVISGGNLKTLNFIKKLYGKIIKAGTYSAPTIKIAEASKILENVQRDINISLMNEAALIFDKLKIDISEVLKASSTKWNFLDFKPGLVGGHCISVDPYYLKYRSEKAGYKPAVISSGRNVNEKMASYVVNKTLKNFSNKQINVCVLGVTYKENCSDIRNSQVLKILNLLERKKINFSFIDPHVRKRDLPHNLSKYYKKNLNSKHDALIFAVPHKEFLRKKMFIIKNLLKKKSIIFDVKDQFNFKNLSKNIKLIKL